MASKKLILGIIGVAAIGYYFYDKNKKESASTANTGTPGTTGPKRLTEAEAIQYGINNTDVAAYFNNDWQKMADHWWGTGFYEGRSYLPGNIKI